MSTPPAPPWNAIEAAVNAARQSPCAKSKRGVAVFGRSGTGVLSVGWNGPPGGSTCGVNEPCGAGMIRMGEKSVCSMVCVHAEARAIRHALAARERALDALHIALSESGFPIPSGGPSCWQCSREVLDAGLAGFWLYEQGPVDGFGKVVTRWKRYTAEEFHRATLIHCGLVQP